jgi:hypothetical protein
LKKLLSLPQRQKIWFLLSIFQPYFFVIDLEELRKKWSQVLKFGSF